MIDLLDPDPASYLMRSRIRISNSNCKEEDMGCSIADVLAVPWAEPLHGYCPSVQPGPAQGTQVKLYPDSYK
jgi:hypothetical protein